MKTKKYFMISALALLACSCQDEGQGGVQPTPGQEVQFGAALEQNGSRTIYGESDGNAYPIYWQNGDEVIVCSPECAIKSATYKVNVGDNTTQNYATSLDKTGEIGVRWGDNPMGNFYSFYPASHAEPSGNYKTMTVTMPAQQDNNIEKNSDGTIKIVRPDMEACFMYASTQADNGTTVNLQYIPLSTAVRFTVRGPQAEGESTITYVRIYAPTGTVIDGSFNIDFEKIDVNTGLPTITADRGRNYVTMNAADPNTNQYLTLKKGESAELCAFLLLTKNETITSDWYIEVGTSDGYHYKKQLVSDGDNNVLVSGKVHDLGVLPTLGSEDWDPSKWMTNLQQNVYLSEISIPGSWNSMNGDCQYSANGTDIAEQYSKGVRAFHIDTRWKATNFAYSEIGDLGVADGGTSGSYLGALFQNANRLMGRNAPTFKDVLTEITSHVSKDEFMVVICTLAQDSYDYNRENGGWKKEISDICAGMSDVVFDGSRITAETVVKDVLGKVIVIVNTNNDYNLGTSPCLFMNMGITLDETVFTGHLSEGGYYDIPLKYGNTSESGIMMYATHAQKTMEGTSGQEDTEDDRGYIPSLSERKQMANNIMSWSNRNHGQTENAHNSWIYMGLGGYVSDSQTGYETVTTYFNDWMNNDIIGQMNTTGYYPVGIVLMNDVISEGTSATIKNILQMNNKYRKAYDPHRSPVDGTFIDGTTGRTVQSAATGYSSGMKDNQINAVSWTRSR